MLGAKVESGKQKRNKLKKILSAKQEAAAHWNSSSYILKCLLRIPKAEHEYVDMQEMSRADVTLISAGPFYIIVANIQHLFWLPTFLLLLFFLFINLPSFMSTPIPRTLAFMSFSVSRKSILLIFFFTQKVNSSLCKE